MNGSLSEEINLRCSNLFDDLGFKRIDDVYLPESFGDSWVILESRDLRVKFIRDRGQIFGDIGSPLEPDSWWQLDLVTELLRMPPITHDYEETGSNKLVILADFLTANYQALAKLFNPEQLSETKRKLESLGRLRAQKLLDTYT